MGTLADKLNYLIGTKNAIKQAIIGKGITVNDNDTFRSYANKINSISTGISLDPLPNPAGAAQILTGKEAYNDQGQKLTGILQPGIDTSDATAIAGDILSGKTAYVAGQKISGTIPSKAAATITPGTSNQTIAAGQYLSGTQTIAGASTLIAGNIKSGVSIFGVTGTYIGGSSTKLKTGTISATVIGITEITIGFQCNYFAAAGFDSSGNIMHIVYYGSDGDYATGASVRSDSYQRSLATVTSTDISFPKGVFQSYSYEYFAVG